jgi:predicted membrane-bound mannosyltransferase
VLRIFKAHLLALNTATVAQRLHSFVVSWPQLTLAHGCFTFFFFCLELLLSASVAAAAAAAASVLLSLRASAEPPVPLAAAAAAAAVDALLLKASTMLGCDHM